MKISKLKVFTALLLVLSFSFGFISLAQNEKAEATVIFKSGTNLNEILQHTKHKKSINDQTYAMKKYTEPIVKNIKGVKTSEKYAINNFIVYGTQSTQKLPAQKRYELVKQFVKENKGIPKSQDDWVTLLVLNNQKTMAKISIANVSPTSGTWQDSGLTLQPGQDYVIAWSSSNLPLNVTILIELLANDGVGKDRIIIADKLPANNTKYAWKVDLSKVVYPTIYTRYRFTATANWQSGGMKYTVGSSSNNFHINNQNITLTSAWKEFNSSIDKFKVLFPAYPTHSTSSQQIINDTTSAKYNDLVMKTSIYTSTQANGVSYFVGSYYYPLELLSTNSELNLKNDLDGMLSAETRLISNKVTNFGKYPALDFTIQSIKDNNIFIKGKSIMVGEVIYRLTVAYEIKNYSENDYNKFINSFVLQ